MQQSSPGSRRQQLRSSVGAARTVFGNAGLLTTNILAFVANSVAPLVGPPGDYIVVPLQGSYPERQAPSRFRLVSRLLPFFRREEESLSELREHLARIGRDPRCQGVVLRFEDLHTGLATAGALRQAISDLKARRKKVVAFLNQFTTTNYYIATAADEIVCTESADFAAVGLSIQAVFLKDALARWGIQADMERLEEYKTGANTFTDSSMPAAEREMLGSLLDSLYSQVVDGIAAGRSLTPDRVSALLDQAPFTAQRAAEEGLVDVVLYEDDLPRHLGSAVHPATLQPWHTAKARLRHGYRWQRTPEAVGVITLRGTIVPGESREVPFAIPLVGGHQAGSETLVRALRRVAQDDSVKAVVCYIESPGGASLASDLIWREVHHVAQQKPVVAYLANVAASGGYYVAVGAHHIVARPETLTGSIGVFGGKLVLQGFYERAKAGVVRLTRGRSAGLYGPERPFDDEERKAVKALLADTYERFKQRVSEGRRMSPEAVQEVAKGRVWTGAQALERGLVDELGDFQAAVARAKALAGLEQAPEVRVVDLTPPLTYVSPPLPATFVLSRLGGMVTQLNHEHVWTLAPWLIQVQ